MLETDWPSPMTRAELIRWARDNAHLHDNREQTLISEPGHWDSGPDRSHTNRYHLAKNQIEALRAKKMLDAAMGCGYGALIMQPEVYVGVDIQDHVMEYATKFVLPWVKGHCEIIKNDLSKKLPFENSTFDFVTSFETIEHIGDEEELTAMREKRKAKHKSNVREEFMHEIWRILMPGGTWMVSSPLTGARQELVSIYHCHEYELSELHADLLRSNYKIRRVYQQTTQEPELIFVNPIVKPRERSDRDKIYYVVFQCEKP